MWIAVVEPASQVVPASRSSARPQEASAINPAPAAAAANHEANIFSYRYDRRHHLAARARDIALASLALSFAAPVIALAMAAIYLEEPGPVIFAQRRVGRFERLFTMYKLRSMRITTCGDDVSPTTGKDRRITRVGAFLRKTSIDELPQLINVIRGDMSLVGPRPEMPFIVRRYHRWQHLRHFATPGITGLWQITLRSTVPLDRPEATVLDLEYIRRASPGFDVRILVGTVRAVLIAKGAF